MDKRSYSDDGDSAEWEGEKTGMWTGVMRGMSMLLAAVVVVEGWKREKCENNAKGES